MALRARGFTLIEVMIALFILALTFVGVITTASHVTRTIDTIQEKTIALWVGQNAVSEITVGIWGTIQDGAAFQQDVHMAGRDFHWKATVTREDHYHHVTVSVMKDKGSSSVAEVSFYDPL